MESNLQNTVYYDSNHFKHPLVFLRSVAVHEKVLIARKRQRCISRRAQEEMKRGVLPLQKLFTHRGKALVIDADQGFDPFFRGYDGCAFSNGRCILWNTEDNI